MKYTTNLALSLATMFLIVLPARADVAPPETAPCSGKQTGAACTYNAAGICQDGTCSRLDYANWDRDASASPPTATYACLKCVTGSATTTATDTGTGSKTATDTTTVTGTPTATDTVTATTTPTATASDTDTATSTPPTATVTVTVTATATATTTTTTTTNPPTATDTTTASNTATATGTKDDEPPADDDGACSIGRGLTAKRIAPWVLAASFSLLFLFARRRRR